MIKLPLATNNNGSNGGGIKTMPVGDAVPLGAGGTTPGRSISGLQTFAPDTAQRLSMSNVAFADTGDYCRTSDGQHGTIDRWGRCVPQVKSGFIF